MQQAIPGANKCTPQYWFLNAGAVPNESPKLQYRNQYWQMVHGITNAPFTSGNDAQALIDGQAYMGDLADKFDRMQAGDSLFTIGWEFTPTQRLRAGGNTLQQYLLGIIQNQGYARFLIFSGPALSKDNPLRPIVDYLLPIPARDHMNMTKALNAAAPAEVRAVLDEQLTDQFGLPSHHQKVIVMSTTHQQVKTWWAYVGGIDLAVDRWDTPLHEKNVMEGNFFAWHDIQCRVRGNGVKQIWANFLDRWRDKVVRRADDKNHVAGIQAIDPAALPTLTADQGAPGTQHIQVLRTLGRNVANTAPVFNFMPAGEQTVHEAYLKAIALAECYIYIEDQFLYDCDLADAIRQRMNQVPNLKVILVLAGETEMGKVHASVAQLHFHLRWRFLQKLVGNNGFGIESNVYPYILDQNQQRLAQTHHDPNIQTHGIYVHSKLLMIDDRYAAIGSANINKRSMTTDTEMTLAIVDATTVNSQLAGSPAVVCQFAQNLRLRLWSEHLGIGLANLDPDPIVSLNLDWPQWGSDREDMQMNHVRCLKRAPVAMPKMLDFDIIQRNFDPYTDPNG